MTEMEIDAMHATESIQKLIAKAIRLADGRPIKEIHVLLGKLTGLTPNQAQAIFDVERRGTQAAGAVLHVRSEPGRAVCLTCGEEWAVQTLSEPCPACGSSRTHMVAGHLVHLSSLTFAGQGYARGQNGRVSRGGPRPREAASARQPVNMQLLE
jgi:hydrogenase nickel incorporation protein HypA/HybF